MTDACIRISMCNELPRIFSTKQPLSEAQPQLKNNFLAYSQNIFTTLSLVQKKLTWASLLLLFLKPSSSKVAFRADLPFTSLLLLLSARRCWGKLNLAKWEGGDKENSVFLIWLSEWQCTTASCWCLSLEKGEKSQIKNSCSGKSLWGISNPSSQYSNE